jgi:ribonuclease D
MNLVTTAADVEVLRRRLGAVDVIALDAEANGLHAYRPRLCVLQLAWRHQGAVEFAIVDPLAVDPAPLAPVLGAGGPLKVLHDLNFDARLLQDAGIVLGHVRDTAVAARFLGEQATGLKTLCGKRLGITISKGLQDHDWASRPFTDEQLGYLAGDVVHLLALDAALDEEAVGRDVAEEIAEECRYKLACSLEPLKPRASPWARLDGWSRLQASQRAVLVALWGVRERLAESVDVPPFRVAPSALLLEIARRQPRTEAELRRAGGARALRHAKEWLAAVARGLEPGAGAPAPVERVSRPPEENARRKHLRGTLLRWRSDEARRREVDPQVVLPGHCADALLDVLSRCDADAAAVAAIGGLGARRVERYLDVWLAMIKPDEPPPA